MAAKKRAPAKRPAKKTKPAARPPLIRPPLRALTGSPVQGDWIFHPEIRRGYVCIVDGRWDAFSAQTEDAATMEVRRILREHVRDHEPDA